MCATLLDRFQALSLQELDSLSLLSRFDTKFVINLNSLESILQSLYRDYSILEIDDKRVFNYINTYFDDENYTFYLKHHNNASNRLKIRNRFYVESNQTFFEVKKKLSSQKTIKLRELNGSLDSSEISFENPDIEDLLSTVNKDGLSAKIIIKYKRITLVSLSNPEKITIDFDINFLPYYTPANTSPPENTIDTNQGKEVKDIVIIEVKQQKANFTTKIFQVLRGLNYKADSSLSKYCIGLLYIGKPLKYNTFKPSLLQINKIQSLFHSH